MTADRLAFLECFDIAERAIVQRLLDSFVYISRDEIRDKLKEHISTIGNLDRIAFIALGHPTESGNEVTTDLRRSLPRQVAVDQCFISDQLKTANLARFDELFFLDDFIGTGGQAIDYFREIGKIEKKITYLYLAGMPAGIRKVDRYFSETFMRYELKPIFDLDIRSAFEPGYVFRDEAEAEVARLICEKYGALLKTFEEPLHQIHYPLGFENCSALFATEYNTPNNTLPIFWSTVSVRVGRCWPAPYPRLHKLSRVPPPPLGFFTLDHKMHEDHMVGSLTIKSIAKYQRFVPPLLYSEIKTALVEPKKLPPELAVYYEHHKEARIAELRSKGKSVEINNGYSLHSARIDKVQVINQPGRKHIPYLEFEPADYSHQIMFGERINEASLIRDHEGDCSIREFIEKDKRVSLAHFDWATVKDIPIPQRFANVVGLVVQRDLKDVSKGKCLISGLRSKAMAVSEEEQLNVWQATMSCAEGMLRPDDANDEALAPPSPFNTAARALRSELGIELGRDYKLRDLKLLALAYDSKRCQPVACFLLEIPDLDYEMVENLWNREAEDNNESPAIFPVPVAPAALSAFLRGDFVWEGRITRMFSNHQQIGLWALAEHFYGAKNLSL